MKSKNIVPHQLTQADLKGRQLLIESSEFLSKIEMDKDLKEAVKMSPGKLGTLIVRNIPVTILNRMNQNQRIYSTKVVQKAIDEAKDAFATKQLLSQSDEHPEGSFVAPTHASHVVIGAYIKKNVELVVEGEAGRYDVLFQDWEVLNTTEGKNLRALFEAECSIGTSIRGVGDMNGKYVEDYTLLGCDCVGNPSSSTFTRMPVSESVKVEYVNPRDLKETFTVTTSSTDVVHDLESAARLQTELERIGYGTVSKTSTKLDSERNPKTGAETRVTTLEAETSDDVATLDQALALAKNAILNGKVSIDSVTIENVKEEEPKESTEEPIYAPAEEQKEVVKEAKDDKEVDTQDNRKFVLKAPNGFVGMDGNSLTFTDAPENALHFVSGKEESGLIHLSGVQKILDTMGVYDVEKYYKREDDGTPKKEGIAGAILGGAAGSLIGHPIIGAAAGSILQDKFGKNKDKKDTKNDKNTKKEGIAGAILGGAAGSLIGHPIIGAAAGSILQDKFGKNKDTKNDKNTKKEGNILDGTPAKNIAGQEEVHHSLSEDDDANTRYSATIKIEGNKNEEQTIPVSATEPNSLIAEVSNQWKQKAGNTNDHVTLIVTDNQDGMQYLYNPRTNGLERLEMQTEATITEDNDDGIEQDDNVLTMTIDGETKVSKEFGSKAQADAARAGMEQNKIAGDIMLSEDSDINLVYIMDVQEKGDDITDYTLKSNPSYVNVLNRQLHTLVRDGVIRHFDKDLDKSTFTLFGLSTADWTAFVESIYDMGTKLRVNDNTNIEDNDMDEKVFNEPSEPSDPFVEEPLTDAVHDALRIVLTDIDWNIDSLFDTGDPEDIDIEDDLSLSRMSPEEYALANDDEQVDYSVYDEIQALPDEYTVIGYKDLLPPVSDTKAFKLAVLDLANQSSNVKIDNAKIKSITKA